MVLFSHGQALCSPFAGIIGNLYNRLHLVAAGSIIWGAMSLGMGFSTNYAEVRSSPFSSAALADMASD
jgi:hypothetical protein